MITRLAGRSTAAALAVLAALFSRVSIESKACWVWLQRLREWRGVGCSWGDAMRLARMAPIAGGASLTEPQHAAAFLLTEIDENGNYCRDTVTVLSGQNLKAGAVVGRVALGIGRVSIPTVVGTGNGTASLVFAGPEVEVGNYVLTCTAAVANGGVWSLTTPSGRALPPFTMTPGAGAATAYTSEHINFSITDGSTDFIVGDVFTFVVSTTAPTVIGGTGTGTISALSLGPDARPGNYRVSCITAVTNGGVFQVTGPGGLSLGQFTMTAGAGASTAFTTRQINFTLTDATDFIVGNSFDVAVFNQLPVLTGAGAPGSGKAVAWDPATFDGRHRAVGVLLADVDATAGDTAGVIIARGAEVIDAALVWGAAVTLAQQLGAKAQLKTLGVVAR